MTDLLPPAALASPAPLSSLAMPLRFHPAREALFNELHTRPFPVLQTPCNLAHLVLLREGAAGDAEHRHLQALCARYMVVPPTPESSCYYQDFGGFELRWERHTEFSTYTLVSKQVQGAPFSQDALALLPEHWLQQLPGQLLSCNHLEIIAAPETQPGPDEMRMHFEGQRLISSSVSDGQARLWSAYRIHRDGSGRLLIHNRGLNPCQSGRLVRTLLEMETYRMMALLSFPVARATLPKLSSHEDRLVKLATEMAETNFNTVTAQAVTATKAAAKKR